MNPVSESSEPDVTKNESNSSEAVRPSWTVAKDFCTKVEVDGYDFQYTLVARISRSDGYRPRFSVVIGRYITKEQGEKAKITMYLPVFARAHNAKVTVNPIHDAVSGLLYEAQAWIREQCQERENEILEERIEKEKQIMEKSKVKKVGGTHA
jgi:hypothetical protein